MTRSFIRLGVNIDHVATVRNARGGLHPDPLRAALIAQNSGADSITAHLREDRRHISDSDIEHIARDISIPLNLEMAATPEMRAIALKHCPHAVCLVPEKREEKTTEGGLNLISNKEYLKEYIAPLQDAGMRLSLFIDPLIENINIAKELNVPVIEFHTGTYCEAFFKQDQHWQKSSLKQLYHAADHAHQLNLEVHAGHGITFDTVTAIAQTPHLKELNIGHFLIGEAIFTGLENAILKMRHLINKTTITDAQP